MDFIVLCYLVLGMLYSILLCLVKQDKLVGHDRILLKNLALILHSIPVFINTTIIMDFIPRTVLSYPVLGLLYSILLSVYQHHHYNESFIVLSYSVLGLLYSILLYIIKTWQDRWKKAG